LPSGDLPSDARIALGTERLVDARDISAFSPGSDRAAEPIVIPDRPAVLLVLCASTVAASCGGTSGAAGEDDASRSGDATTRSRADGDVSDGGGDSGDASIAHDAGQDDGPGAEAQAIDGGQDGSSCPASATPPAIAGSTGTVVFVVTNHAAAARYVITNGESCDPFAVDGQQLSVPFSCVCECAVPRTSFTLTTVAAGQSVTLTWDGRHIVPYTTYVDCRTYGYSQGCATVANGSAQPTGAGARTVSVGYATQVPTSNAVAGCTSAPSGFQCTAMSGSTNAQCGSGFVAGPAGPSIQLATQAFELPASGDVTVQVSIP
jgi:hypothetical protein